LPRVRSTRPELQRRFGPGAGSGAAAVRRREPACLAQGDRHPGRCDPALIGRGAATRGAGNRRARAGATLRSLADAHRGRIGCFIGYDEDLAHLSRPVRCRAGVRRVSSPGG
jgi:hypothetical protein